MGIVFVVPAAAIGAVREGLFGLMGSATQGLDHALLSVGREFSPEWFQEDRRRIEDAFALLDRVGWSAAVGPQDVELDLQRYGQRVREALECFLPILENQQQEAVEEPASA
jgi:hypothetical protein